MNPGYVLSDHCTLIPNKEENIGATEAADGTKQGGESSQTNGESDCTDLNDSFNSSGKPKISRTGVQEQE